MKTVLRFADGREVSSGQTGESAIAHFSLTQCVYESVELTLGSVCSAMAELELITPGGDLAVTQGEEFTIIRRSDDGACHPIGIFIAQKPVRSSANTMKLTAYDRVSKLDRDLTAWLEGLTGWPYTLQEFAQMVCRACQVELAEGELPNGNYGVERFTANGVSGRQLLRWVGQISGRFCRCTPEGKLEFAWYSPSAVAVRPGGERYYYQGKLSYADYEVAPIDKVQLRQNEEDVGTVYPADAGEANAYIITGNPLLSAQGGDSLVGIAQTLYEQLHGVTYRPAKLSLPADLSVNAGDVVTVTDRNGVTMTVYIMTRTQKGGSDTWECTGSPRRDSSSAVNATGYQSLSGKVLNLKTTVDGLKAENRDMAGKMAGISLDVEGIATEVSRQQSQMESVSSKLTAMTQTAETLELAVRKISQEGTNQVVTETGFTFDDRGLTISKSGTQMENLLDETGMFVKRSGEVILQADQEGVRATDVSVRNYLIVGEHARLEDYSSGADSKRTACFWI